MGEGQDAYYSLSLNGDTCLISREMGKKIIRWQEFIFIILSRSESRIHVRIFSLSGYLAQVLQAHSQVEFCKIIISFSICMCMLWFKFLLFKIWSNQIDFQIFPLFQNNIIIMNTRWGEMKLKLVWNFSNQGKFQPQHVFNRCYY